MGFLDGIGAEIKDILYGYIKAESFTNTPGERAAERFFTDYFAGLPYFEKHPEYFGARPIADDSLGRAVCYAMVRGSRAAAENGGDTIVMLHHYDVVEIDDFKLLKPFAFSPDELALELKKIKGTLHPEVMADLESDGWLFGRGVCDMKGGGAIQMAMLRRYSQLEDFNGNLIVLGVPDEENLSAGMRAAVLLLDELRQKYGLCYRMAINSEPHQRKTPEKGIFSTGSVGKVMPFIYARGSLAHAGKVFEGFNPLGLMAEIARRTEMNMELSDTEEGEAAPPPTWLYLRDDKKQYDVSMPLSVFGCFSVLTLNQTPPTTMQAVQRICEDSFARVLARMEENHARYQRARGEAETPLPWRVRVMDFSALYREAQEGHGEEFVAAYDSFVSRLEKRLAAGDISLIECHTELLPFVYDYIDDLSPRIVYGLMPPYYPNVSNHLLPKLDKTVQELPVLLDAFAGQEFGQSYETEKYYTGISDLSYTSISDSAGITAALEGSMPLFGRMYSLPLDSVEAIAMPCINIGPWGKDFHKLTERVLCEDLYVRTPAILHHAITTLLG